MGVLSLTFLPSCVNDTTIKKCELSNRITLQNRSKIWQYFSILIKGLFSCPFNVLIKNTLCSRHFYFCILYYFFSSRTLRAFQFITIITVMCFMFPIKIKKINLIYLNILSYKIVNVRVHCTLQYINKYISDQK